MQYIKVASLSLGFIAAVWAVAHSPHTSAADKAEPCSEAPKGRWIEVAQNLEPRAGAASIVLADGRVLTTGGRGESALSPARKSAELYEPKTDKWTRVAPMHHAREHHELVLLPGGDVIASGGTDAPAERYNPKTNKWTVLNQPTRGRAGASVGVRPDGQVVSFGGMLIYREPATYYESAKDGDLYDPAQGKWARLPELRTAHDGGAGAVSNDGTLVMVGGTYVKPTKWPRRRWFFPPSTKKSESIELLRHGQASWIQLNWPKHYRGIGAAITALSAKEVLILPGIDEALGNKDAVVLDLERTKWVQVASMSTERSSPLLVRVAAGQVMALGGAAPGAPAELFCAKTRSWQQLQAPPATYADQAVHLGQGSVLILGDYSQPSRVFRYVPERVK